LPCAVFFLHVPCSLRNQFFPRLLVLFFAELGRSFSSWKSFPFHFSAFPSQQRARFLFSVPFPTTPFFRFPGFVSQFLPYRWDDLFPPSGYVPQRVFLATGGFQSFTSYPFLCLQKDGRSLSQPKSSCHAEAPRGPVVVPPQGACPVPLKSRVFLYESRISIPFRGGSGRAPCILSSSPEGVKYALKRKEPFSESLFHIFGRWVVPTRRLAFFWIACPFPWFVLFVFVLHRASFFREGSPPVQTFLPPPRQIPFSLPSYAFSRRSLKCGGWARPGTGATFLPGLNFPP